MDSKNQQDTSSLNPLPKSKIKISCILSDSCDEFNLEVSNKISIRTLKRRISERLKYQRGKSFNVIYNEKDLTNFNKLKLSDVFSRNTHDISTDYYQTETGSLDSVRLKIIPKTISYSPSETKLKYMLECQHHQSENAHYYCFNCQKSFCSLCIEEHTTHDFIDKYDYSKSNEEIVNDIMKNFVFEVLNKQKEHEENSNNNNNGTKAYYLSILNGIDKDTNDKSKSSSSFDLLSSAKEKVKELSDTMLNVYNEYIDHAKMICEGSLKEKSDDFKSQLTKFKSICNKNLSVLAHNKKSFTDIIALDDDYFKEIRNTLNEFKIGKEALIKYLQVRNDECVNELNDIDAFNKEIAFDIEAIITKIKSKRDNKPSNTNSPNDIDEDDQINTIKEAYTPSKNMNSNCIKIIESESESETEIQTAQGKSKSNSTQSIIKQHYAKFIIKRKLIHEIFIYNTTEKKFISTKTFKVDKAKFKKFLKFSVFININDTLYISGGKNKEEKCVKDFYSYSSQNNSLLVLPSMLKERCSHSMIYINTDTIHSEVFAIGGFATNSCERYSISKRKWSQLPELNSKEKQVPTLFVINNKYLYCAFGFSNETIELPDLAEVIDLTELNKWMSIVIDNKIEQYALKRFNVGIIPLASNEFLLIGGEQYKGEETDSVFNMTVNSFDDEGCGKITVYNNDNGKLTLPLKCSFIDKQFLEIKPNKYAQFEMKKNNLIVFNSNKKAFKIKTF